MSYSYTFSIPDTVNRRTKTFMGVDDLIRMDHDLIRSLYSAYKTGNATDRVRYANEFIRKLAVHSHAEEIIVYPAFSQRLVRGNDVADHSREEHLKLKHELYRLDKMNPQQPGYENQMDRVMGILNHHMEEEETQFLPQLKQSCWENELVALGEQFENIKDKVPTHPHPWAPDKPPLESLVGLLQAPIDKGYDMIAREFPDRLPDVPRRDQ